MGNTLLSNSSSVETEPSPDLNLSNSSSIESNVVSNLSETEATILSLKDKMLCEYCQEYSHKQFHEQHIRICSSNPANFRMDLEFNLRRNKVIFNADSQSELQKTTCDFCNETCFATYQANHQRVCPKNPENIKINCDHCKRTLNLLIYQDHLDSCEETHGQKRRLSENLSRSQDPTSRNLKKLKTNNNIFMRTCESPKTERQKRVLPECSICLEGIQHEFSKATLQCSHSFHRTCIQKWFRRQRRCPNCRKGF